MADNDADLVALLYIKENAFYSFNNFQWPSICHNRLACITRLLDIVPELIASVLTLKCNSASPIIIKSNLNRLQMVF